MQEEYDPTVNLNDFKEETFMLMRKEEISESGLALFCRIMDLTMSYLSANFEFFKKTGSINGVISIMIKNSSNLDFRVKNTMISSQEDKILLFNEIKSTVDVEAYECVINIMEAWCSLDPERMPSLDSKKTEAVVTTIHLNVGFKPFIFVCIQEILRKKGKAYLDLPQMTIHSTNQVGGNFVGFEDKLCPIT